MIESLLNHKTDSIYLIKDTIISSGSFLLFNFLNTLQGPILFLGYSQDKEHYQHIQKRLGITVEYKFIDCMDLNDISEILLDSLEKNLIIDDISTLLFTSDLKTSISTLKKIIELVKGSLVLLTHQIKGDEDLNSFNTWLQYQSNVVITCNPLESGYSDGIDGQVIVKQGPQKGSCINGELLYKLSDSGVTYYAKGTANL
ncbi:hypothetical protein HDV01_001535 [Terramyces sp. JEL0728]|nr:hypothetical protein HDV01_001535 [Terramyces sp. JEL0728]